MYDIGHWSLMCMCILVQYMLCIRMTGTAMVAHSV